LVFIESIQVFKLFSRGQTKFNMHSVSTICCKQSVNPTGSNLQQKKMWPAVTVPHSEPCVLELSWKQSSQPSTSWVLHLETLTHWGQVTQICVF